MDIREKNTSSAIANKMADIHLLTPNLNQHTPSEYKINVVWSRIEEWTQRAQVILSNLSIKNDNFLLDRIERMGLYWHHTENGLQRMISDIKLFRNKLDVLACPLVFCHNDLQYGNLLRLKSDESIFAVDYEYAGFNTRAYDIANHWCEWYEFDHLLFQKDTSISIVLYRAANYHSAQPHLLNYNLFPTSIEQDFFLEAYLKSVQSYSNSSVNFDLKEECKLLKTEVLAFIPVSHLFWALWALLQGEISQIDFDFTDYALQVLSAIK